MFSNGWILLLLYATSGYLCIGTSPRGLQARRFVSWNAKSKRKPSSYIFKTSRRTTTGNKPPVEELSKEEIHVKTNVETRDCPRPIYPRCPAITWEPNLQRGLCRMCENNAQCCMGRICCDIGNPEGKCCVNPINNPRCPAVQWVPKMQSFCHECSGDMPCQESKVCCNVGNPEGKNCCLQPIPEEGFRIPNNFVLYEDKSTYEEAEMTCHSSGLRLAVVRDNQTQSQVMELLTGTDLEVDVWIGLKNKNEEEFIWADGHILAANKKCGFYEYWQSEEPNNYLSHKKPSCVKMTFPAKPESARGRWLDENCKKKMFFLCENINF